MKDFHNLENPEPWLLKFIELARSCPVVYRNEEHRAKVMAVKAKMLEMAKAAAGTSGALLLLYGAGLMAWHDLQWFLNTGVLP